MYVCIIYGGVEAWMHMHIQCIYIHTCTFLPRKREQVVGAHGIRYKVCMCVCIIYWYICMYVSYMDGWKHGCMCIFSMYIYIRAHFCIASGSTWWAPAKSGIESVFVCVLFIGMYVCMYVSYVDGWKHGFI